MLDLLKKLQLFLMLLPLSNFCYGVPTILFLIKIPVIVTNYLPLANINLIYNKNTFSLIYRKLSI